MEREFMLDELTTTHRWNQTTLNLAIQSGFKCEYCDRDLIISVDDYSGVQLDHILPKSKYPQYENDFNNLATACRFCNFLKRAWNPSNPAQPNLGRDELIKRVRDHLAPMRNKYEKYNIYMMFVAVSLNLCQGQWLRRKTCNSV